MGLLEDSLRDTFAHRADAPAAVEGLAERAIAGARRVRRRRVVSASAAAALAVALIAFGGLTVATRPGGLVGPGTPGASSGLTVLPTAPATDGGLPFEAVDNGTMFVEGGAQLSVAGLGKVDAAWRVAGGYLLDGLGQLSATLWYIPAADGTGAPNVNARVALASGLAFTVGRNADGQTAVAWVDDNSLNVGTLTNGALTSVRTSAGRPAIGDGSPATAPPLWPQAVVGGVVVLAGSQTGGGLDTWDVWYPDRGTYRSTPDSLKLADMFGVTTDRERILGRYDDGSGQKPGCLGEINPADLTRVHSTCPSPFDVNDQVLPSPDGRWWMVSGPAGLRLYDAGQVWSGAGPAHTWPTNTYGGRWAVDGTAFAAITTTDKIATFYLDGHQESTALPPGMTGAAKVVVDLR